MLSLIHAAHLLESRIEDALGTVGLSMAKFGVLELLAKADEPMPLGELAAGKACVRSNMTQLVDRLEAEDLVRRIDDPADRRIKRVQLTPTGIERYQAGVKKMEEVHARFAAALPEDQRHTLSRVLASLK
jgi:DNA-binding MarR family transcriptional regulator